MKKLLIVLFLVGAILLAGCTQQQSESIGQASGTVGIQVMRTVSTFVSPYPSYGTISPISRVTVNNGTPVSFTARANSGYTFKYWLTDTILCPIVSGGGNSANITVRANGDCTLIASFKKGGAISIVTK